MSTIEEKRVYGEKSGRREVLVAGGVGLVVVAVSGDSVGEFGVEHRCSARDVAADGLVAVAAEEDVFVGEEPGSLAKAGFGSAVAVDVHEGAVLAAGEDGRVARYRPENERGAWTVLGYTGSDVRAVDGPLVGTADGVHRVVADELRDAGLDDVRDVAGCGVPLAATAGGLFELGNGWMDTLDGPFDVVDGDADGRAHAVGDGDADGNAVYSRTDGEWTPVDLPTDERFAGFAYAPDTVVALTASGTLLVDAGDGWRSQALGLRGASAVAVR